MLSRPTINRMYDELVESGNDYADKKAASSLLQETRKSLLAKLGNESGLSSAAAKESFALAHPSYAEHVAKMVEAERIEIRARVMWESKKIYSELLRTSEATERAANRSAV